MTPRNWCLGIPESYQISCLKFTYLTCATVITTSFIIECILVHLVVQPYIHESAFSHTSCTYLHSDIIRQNVKCENKCSKDRSRFPCLKVLVSYYTGGDNHTVVLYDNIATYQHYKYLGCATSSCHHRDTDNTAWVDQFRLRVQHQKHFGCYIHATHEDEALLFKFYSTNTVFHAVFWPVSLFCTSLVCVSCAYVVDRCRVWTGDQSVIV
ncbi:Calcium activated potassium channel subunit [Fasciola hepatica]|uniref:Calcium activated potassium channel subunit n=1 Tax=Fasciola hepatica TaxID=6192 RepID=A0A4E0RIE4_FASHE|nr:Calcium activated potassium channel subunit [Fasciola hepatica]